MSNVRKFKDYNTFSRRAQKMLEDVARRKDLVWQVNENTLPKIIKELEPSYADRKVYLDREGRPLLCGIPVETGLYLKPDALYLDCDEWTMAEAKVVGEN